MCVLILRPTWIHQWSLHVCSFHKPHMDQSLESLRVCYFHKPHMDQPVVIACVFFSTNHTWIHQCSLYVCSFHKPHINQPGSLHVCSFHKPHMDQPLESLHVCLILK